MKSIRLPALAALLSLAAPVASQGSILPYLPQDTIIAVTAPDLRSSLDQFRGMPLAKMWHEEETQNFLADVIELMNAKWQEGMAQAKEMHAQGALPVDPEQIAKLWVNGCTIAVTKLQLQVGDFGPQPKVGIVMHLDFGDTAALWAPLIQMGLTALESEAGAEVTKTETKVGEWPLVTFAPNDAQGIEMALNVLTVPGGLLLGTLTEDLKAIAENMQKKAPALTATEGYVAAAKHLTPEGAECESFVRMDPIVTFLLEGIRIGVEMNPGMKDVDMDGVERAVVAMGLRKLGVMGETSNYVDGKAITKSYWVRPEAGKTAAPKAIDTSFLKWVPKDAVGFRAGTLDLMSIYDTLLKGLQAYDPEFATKTLAQLAETEKQLGFRVREDLFGSAGDHYVSWSMPMGTISSAPEVAFLLKVNDEQKLVTVLKNLAKLTEGMVEVEEGEKRGLMVYQLRINYDPTQGMGTNFLDMFTPTFAFKNGYMVAGFSANDIKRVFQRMEREDDPKGDIRSNKEFAAVASLIPEGVDSLVFTDWKAQFESLYQIATGLLAFVPMGEDVPIDTSLLPESGNLTKHLFGGIAYTKTEAGGMQSVSIGPFGPEATVLLGTVIVGAAVGLGVMRGGGF